MFSRAGGPELNRAEWDEAFSNAAYIPDGSSYPLRWKSAAKAFRKKHTNSELDLSYGTHPRQKFDLFWPDAKPKGLAIFIHGGFWLDFDKTHWSHLAAGPCAMGWVVAIPSYVLAPEARISEITRAIGLAIDACAIHVNGPICLAGHSAGGHLASRMICEDSPITIANVDRLKRVISISGLHDLRPLLQTRMNDRLRLDAEEAELESPALRSPNSSASLVCWVGSKERPEFLRQSRILAQAWKSRIRDLRHVLDPDRHHFDVIAPLEYPESMLTAAFVMDDG